MTKIAYLQCPTGIAGDMCLGALVHAGCPLEYLIEKLNLLGISAEYRLRAENVLRQGQMATKVYVDLTAELQTGPKEVEKEPPTFVRHDRDRPSAPHTHSTGRHLPEIEEKILAAGLPARAESWSLAVFRKVAEAEAAVHGMTPDKVHFHEVGATDAIVDIVGTCLGLDWLGIDRLYCSPLPVGGGTVWAAHDRLSVPVPAVLKLWESRRVPVYSNGIEKELVTPTGAAIVCTLATEFGEVPEMAFERIGLGAGSQDFALPNILRLWIGSPPAPANSGGGRGESSTNNPRRTSSRTGVSPVPVAKQTQSRTTNPSSTQTTGGPILETISVLETQIDDCNPQAIAYTFDLLLAAGALDVFARSITMKKSRLGVLLTVICHPEKSSICEEIIFRETSTLGIRRCSQQRAILEREIEKVETLYGEVRVKIGKMGDRLFNAQPEYEDCAKLAKQQNVSWREVHRLALENWYKLRS
ncbi:MAG: nickel pincer cofactor biosynthesis protein LarC [Cyanobacteriota bacterium]|nr:nickel pincer cofactor biosynthesis protein LarC [Cyanobacteriota bacterium]